MIKVTDDAKSMLGEIIDKVLDNVKEPEIERNKVGLRLMLQDEGLGLGVDLPRDGDQIIEQDGNPVLLVDPSIDQVLDGAVVATEETPDGRKLTITRDMAA